MLFRSIDPKKKQSLERILVRLSEEEDKYLGVTLPVLKTILTSKQTWLVERVFGLLTKAWDDDVICANDVYFILLHFLGQCDQTKVSWSFTGLFLR